MNAAASLGERWEALANLLSEHADLLAERPTGDAVPPSLIRRGWDAFLEALDERALDAFECGTMAWADGAPPSLTNFVERARACVEVPPFPAGSMRLRAERRQTPRKHQQVEAFARLVVPVASRARRVVDVGCGHGHLTRAIARQTRVPTVGIDRSASLVATANALSDAPDDPRFEVSDVLEDGLGLRSGDCVVGLHACGELADRIVREAAPTGAAVAIVGCCLQKRRADVRRSLAAPSDDRLAFARGILGLSNLTHRDAGVEAARRDNLAARERRLALLRLLERAVGALRFGAEIDGLNRRAANADLGTLVTRAFTLRQLPPPRAHDVEEAAAWARVAHPRLRRRAVPRTLLARALEVFVLVDRARFLEAHGMRAHIGTLFSDDVSARNLALLAETNDGPAATLPG